MHYPLILSDTTFDAVVLADGDYPHQPVALDILERANKVVCCDGAVLNYPHRPYAIVGDGDSISEELRQKYADIFFPVAEQEDNDLTKATRYCVAQGWKDIAYLGATGKREDHTLGNIALMMRYMGDFGLRVTMITDYGYFTPAQGMNTFATFPHQQVSIYNFGCHSLRGEGFRWQVYNYDSLWQGTLNEAMGGKVTLSGDGQYLVFRTFEEK